MAKTSGHGNPKWTRDETILALDLYLACGGRVPSANDKRIIALSNILRSLPYHTSRDKRATFRNPDGVAFKLQNLRQVGTGKGLGNVSAMDRSVWEQFASNAEYVRTVAKLIIDGLAIPDGVDEGALDDEADEFPEGRIVTRLHQRRERSRGLRRALIKARRLRGALTCEVCTLSEGGMPPEMGDALFEAHHIIPVCEIGERKTRVKDLALLCACCHRLVHRAIAREARWITIEEARALLPRLRAA